MCFYQKQPSCVIESTVSISLYVSVTDCEWWWTSCSVGDILTQLFVTSCSLVPPLPVHCKVNERLSPAQDVVGLVRKGTTGHGLSAIH